MRTLGGPQYGPPMAGDSADEVARRAREKAERLLRNAEMWEKGAAGERAVQEILATLPSEWTVFHDLHWPGRARANIDHLVIGPGGVFVIDAKNWSGSVQVRDGVLRQNGYRRDSAVESAVAAAQAISALTPSLPRSWVSPMVCFTGEGSIDGSLRGVTLCSSAKLIDVLLGRPLIVSREWLDYLRFELDMLTRSATGPAAASFTLASVRQPRTVVAPLRSAAPVRRRASAKTRTPLRTAKRFVFGFGFLMISTLVLVLPWPAVRNDSSLGGPLSIALLVAAFFASRRFVD